MDLIKEKEKRISYLREIYKVAKQEVPTSPTSAFFGLSKTRPYSFKTKEFINNDEERGGYIIGEQLGLSQQEVDSIVGYFSSREVGYMSSTLGLKNFNITQHGILFLESLEEEQIPPLQILNNHITVGDINSPTLFQQNSHHSIQTQEVNFSTDHVQELFRLLKKDAEKLIDEQQQELESEISYAKRQLDKGKDIKPQLHNIGAFIKDVGLNVFANLVASPVYEIMKPVLGLH